MKHIKINDDAHHVAKVAAASAGVTLEQWIAQAIARAAKKGN
jgi:predicted HicB family RNase H-like nuclease